MTSGGASDQKTRARVNIFDQEYVVKAEYSSERIEELAEHVDKKMRELKKNNPNLNPTKLAVLTALNFSDELYQLRSEYENLLQLIEEEKRK